MLGLYNYIDLTLSNSIHSSKNMQYQSQGSPKIVSLRYFKVAGSFQSRAVPCLFTSFIRMYFIWLDFIHILFSLMHYFLFIKSLFVWFSLFTFFCFASSWNIFSPYVNFLLFFSVFIIYLFIDCFHPHTFHAWVLYSYIFHRSVFISKSFIHIRNNPFAIIDIKARTIIYW